MRFLSSIVWSEGMYLGPHHFQAQSRYFEDAIRFAVQSLWYEAYGFTGFELSEEALKNGTVSIKHGRGIFRDGLAFDMPASDEIPPPRNIVDLFPPTRDHLLAYIAIPPRRPDGQNFSLESMADGNTRYGCASKAVPDENTGHDEKQIQLGRKNIRLLFDTEDLSDVEALPIARIKRDTRGQFVYDDRFIPPCVQLTASESLLMMLRRLIEILEEKSSTLRSGRTEQGRFKAGMSSHDVASFWFLHSINAGLGPLRHLYLSKRGHPEELFREMSRLAGALCTFTVESHPRDLPAYDHGNLDRCFAQLDEHICRHLEIMIPSQAIKIALTQPARCFYEAAVEDTRAFGSTRWLLAIHSPMGEADLIQKIPTVVKVCSAKFVPELVKRALPGLKLAHMPVPPSQVAPKVEYQYFAVSKSGPCWEHILQTKEIGVYVPVDVPNPEVEVIVVLEG